jgi:hypothetical protein
MSETQFSEDPLSINEDKFLPLFQEQLILTLHMESTSMMIIQLILMIIVVTMVIVSLRPMVESLVQLMCSLI